MRDTQGNNVTLLGTGDNASDHSHVTLQTPMQTKKAEYANDPMYKTKAESDLNRSREKAVTAARRGSDVRPLSGGIAK